MNTKGIIFDLDGTLWDSSEGVVKSWNKVIENYKDISYRMTFEKIKGYMGRTIDEIAKMFFINISEEEANKIIRKCCKMEETYLAENGGLLYPDLEETLVKLSEKYKLFIVSNCQGGYIEAFFKYHKLKPYFTDYESAGRTGKTKGENIKFIIERNQLERSVYIGDTLGDFQAAKEADIPFIFAKYGFGNIDESVIYVNSVSDIPEMADKIFAK